MSYPHNPTLILLLVILLAGVVWIKPSTTNELLIDTKLVIEPAAKGGDVHERGDQSSRDVATGAAHPNNAAIQGVTGKGSAFVLYRSETGLVREFVVKFTGERR